jgi:tRNA1Val (adenine37-N6)-methyltransferase
VNIRDEDKTVLDIGTGSGVVALMVAQRSSPQTHIDAVEDQPLDAQQARENVRQSPWPDKIHVHHSDVQAFFPQRRYNLVVSNPPYFVSSQLPPDQRRSRARHTHSLPFEDLLESAARLLDKNGRLALILPYTEGMHFQNLARGFSLFPIRRTTFRTRVNKPAKRVLLELAREGHGEITETEIVLYGPGNNWSAEYRMLTGEFYLEA